MLRFFVLAAALNGVSWWSFFLAQTGGVTMLEAIQLGGTGGLVVALCLGLYYQRQDYVAAKKEWAAERQRHGQQIESLLAKRDADIAEAQDRLMAEMKTQIESMRMEGSQKTASASLLESQIAELRQMIERQADE